MMEVATLEQRLERLERRFRRWWWVGIIFAILVGTPVLAVMVALLFRVRGVHEADQILILDKDHRVRMDIGTWDDGSPRLLLAGASGTPRMEIRVDADEAPVMQMRDEGGKVRLSMAVGREGPTFSLNGKDENARLMMTLAGDSVPSVVMHDVRSKLRALLSIEENGSPMLRFTDSDENPRMAIVVDKAGLPSLAMIDKEGKVRFAVQLDKDGNPVGTRTRP
jgi:hypothetical protein